MFTHEATTSFPHEAPQESGGVLLGGGAQRKLEAACSTSKKEILSPKVCFYRNVKCQCRRLGLGLGVAFIWEHMMDEGAVITHVINMTCTNSCCHHRWLWCRMALFVQFLYAACHSFTDDPQIYVVTSPENLVTQCQANNLMNKTHFN